MPGSEPIQCYEGDGDERPGLTDGLLTHAADELHVAMSFFVRSSEDWTKFATTNQAHLKLHRAYNALIKLRDDVNLARRKGTLMAETLTALRNVETMRRWFNGVFKNAMMINEAFGTATMGADLVQLMGCVLKWQDVLIPKETD